MTENIKKVILTRLEELPMKHRVEHGLSGRAIIEVTKNSPLTKNIIKLSEGYVTYFNSKIKEGKLSPEQIRELAKGF